MITLKYLGKKEGFTLNLPFLSRPYHVEGPDATVDFTNDDATQMMAANPRMFRVEGIKVGPDENIVDAAAEGLPVPDPLPDPPKPEPSEPEQSDIGIPISENSEPLVLTGDGVEGTADEAVPMGVLMGYKADELRTYAMQRFGHQFTDEKRNQMIKKITELEQKKAQAAA